MKKTFLLFAIVLLAATAFRSDSSEAYMPVFMSRETLENSVKYIAGTRDMIQTGKIYYRAPYIYVNERYKGVHVINNTVQTSSFSPYFVNTKKL